LGQHQTEGGAVVDLRLVLERAAVFLDNAGRNRQAQPGAALLGGKKGSVWRLVRTSSIQWLSRSDSLVNCRQSADSSSNS
jgi:hypothetical protein